MRTRSMLLVITIGTMALAMTAGEATHKQETDMYLLGRRVVTPVGTGGGSSTSFTPDFAPNQIKLTDQVSEYVGFLICQDGGDSVCGQQAPGTDPDVTEEGCAESGRWTNLTQQFAADTGTTIFINLIDPAGTDECAGWLGTVGEVSIRRTH